MDELDELYFQQDWQRFAAKFKELYMSASSEHKLRLLRDLLSRWRHKAVLTEVAKLEFLG